MSNTVRSWLCRPWLLSLLALCATQARPQQLIKPEGQQTTLQGTVKLIHGFGPPGYGEDPKHDAHVSYWAIHVPVPVNFVCTPEDKKFAETDCAPATELKLFFPGLELERLGDLPAARWAGREVLITGKLYRADTAGEMTLIYMDVATITAASTQKRESR